MPDLVAVFMIGLLGSAHCIGMCGGFLLVLTQHPHCRDHSHAHQGVYFAGKTLTYMLLGALAGAGGGAVAHLLAGWQSALSLALGLLLLWIGLGLVGVLPAVRGPAPPRGAGRLTRALAFFLRRGGVGGTLGMGLVNGLLPCGLVYALLAQAAATASPFGGALTMAVFGLSTIPALALTALLGRLARPAWRTRLNLASGVLVIVLGLVTIARGLPAMDALHDGHSATMEMSATASQARLTPLPASSQKAAPFASCSAALIDKTCCTSQDVVGDYETRSGRLRDA